MQQAHGPVLVLRGAGFHDGADEHFQQAAAHGIDDGGDEQAYIGIGHGVRQPGHQHKPKARKSMGQNRARAVADAVDKDHGSRIYAELQEEIEGHQQSNLLQGNIVSIVKGEVEQRREIDDHRLDAGTHKAGQNRPVVFIVHGRLPSLMYCRGTGIIML